MDDGQCCEIRLLRLIITNKLGWAGVTGGTGAKVDVEVVPA